ncbi:MAG: (2Fe-2S)-binding protein [Candidatus Eremiobacteraeota bacterium]|nr:(2Fe-2S)-binding protein [Candidatus Eremiobacteraeota bacterium]
MAKSITFTLNGRPTTVDVEHPSEPLLYVLRDRLGLGGPKFGCGLGQCGACTVIVNGAPMRSCSLAVEETAHAKVTTIEGLGDERNPHPLQRAFIAEQAAQCGYCIDGMIVTAAALLQRNPHPSDPQIKEALEGNLCRCGTHLRILRAIKRASA